MNKILLMLGLATALTGCGNSWEVAKKEINSNLGDLKRDVKVYDSLSKETLWEYVGDVYLTDSSSPGDITIIYRDSRGKVRKNDFIGTHIAISMREVAN